jgi:hypothetical protein
MNCMIILFVQINEDLEGTIQFLAQTGPFVIPLVCTTKKCDVSIQIVHRIFLLFITIYFQRITRHVQLFRFLTVTAQCCVDVQYSL